MDSQPAATHAAMATAGPAEQWQLCYRGSERRVPAGLESAAGGLFILRKTQVGSPAGYVESADRRVVLTFENCTQSGEWAVFVQPHLPTTANPQLVMRTVGFGNSGLVGADTTSSFLRWSSSRL